MPLVIPRSSSARPEDAVLLRMAHEVARQRSQRLSVDSTTAAKIVYRQKAAYERSIKRPVLPRPKAEDGYSTPEWDIPRACWLAYLLADSRKWEAWEAFQEKWVDLQAFDNGTTGKPNVIPPPTASIAASDVPKIRTHDTDAVGILKTDEPGNGVGASADVGQDSVALSGAQNEEMKIEGVNREGSKERNKDDGLTSDEGGKRLTLKTLGQAVMKVLAWQRRATNGAE